MLRGEIAYSSNHVYFIFEPYALELVFALSIYHKCRKHGIPCELHSSKSVELDKLPVEVIKCAEHWAERKLWRRCYKLKELRL